VPGKTLLGHQFVLIAAIEFARYVQWPVWPWNTSPIKKPKKASADHAKLA